MTRALLAAVVLAALALPARAQQAPAAPAEPPADGMLDVFKVQGNVWLVAGAGGNIAVQVGEQGLVIVDTGAAGLTEQVMTAIRGISTQPIRYIINTSMAPQHVGGNATLAVLPGGSLTGGTRGATPAVVAQENILNRMTALGPDGQSRFPTAAWPTDGYFAPRRGFTFNGEAIDIIHLPRAYSDADSAVYFRGSNVLVTGDVYTTTGFPTVNRAEGGTYPGVLAALNTLLDITVPDDLMEGGTFVIPGHGRVSDEADLVEYRDMAQIIADRVRKLAADGRSLAQIKTARPAMGWEARYSRDGWTTEMFIDAIYPDLAPRPAAPPAPARPRGGR